MTLSPRSTSLRRAHPTRSSASTERSHCFLSGCAPRHGGVPGGIVGLPRRRSNDGRYRAGRSMALPPDTPPASVQDFYARVETAVPELDQRLRAFLDEYRAHRVDGTGPLRVLDIGCGRRALLAHAIEPADVYTGCDIVEPDNMGIEQFVSIDLNQERLAERLSGDRFDVIFCGEVVEH